VQALNAIKTVEKRFKSIDDILPKRPYPLVAQVELCREQTVYASKAAFFTSE
jgi:hypothetical protein